MFRKNNIICLELSGYNLEPLSVKKNGVNFSIRIKETIEKDGVGKFVWFLHVELPKRKEYKLLAYNTTPQNGYTKCQEEAFIFLNNLKSDFYKNIKDQ